MKVYITLQRNRPGEPHSCRDQHHTSPFCAAILYSFVYTMSIERNAIRFRSKCGYNNSIFFKYGLIDNRQVIPIVFLCLAIAVRERAGYGNNERYNKT